MCAPVPVDGFVVVYDDVRAICTPDKYSYAKSIV
jgi:hypothetical protein